MLGLPRLGPARWAPGGGCGESRAQEEVGTRRPPGSWSVRAAPCVPCTSQLKPSAWRPGRRPCSTTSPPSWAGEVARAGRNAESTPTTGDEVAACTPNIAVGFQHHDCQKRLRRTTLTPTRQRQRGQRSCADMYRLQNSPRPFGMTTRTLRPLQVTCLSGQVSLLNCLARRSRDCRASLPSTQLSAPVGPDAGQSDTEAREQSTGHRHRSRLDPELAASCRDGHSDRRERDNK